MGKYLRASGAHRPRRALGRGGVWLPALGVARPASARLSRKRWGLGPPRRRVSWRLPAAAARPEPGRVPWRAFSSAQAATARAAGVREVVGADLSQDAEHRLAGRRTKAAGERPGDDVADQCSAGERADSLPRLSRLATMRHVSGAGLLRLGFRVLTAGQGFGLTLGCGHGCARRLVDQTGAGSEAADRKR